MKQHSGLGRVLARYQVHPKIRLVVERHPSAASASIGFFVKCGSRHEPRHLHGMTHFAEHMFFKGTTKHSAEEISQTIERTGGDINAFTDREYTCFHAWVPKDQTQLALDLLCEMIFDSLLEPQDFLKEREVIVQELQGYEQSPDDEFSDNQLEVPWKGFALGDRVGGFSNRVAKLSHEELLGHIRDVFLRSEMVVTVVSSHSPDKIKEQLMKSLAKAEDYLWGGSLRKALPRHPRSVPKMTEPFYEMSQSKKFAVDQVQAAFFWPGVALSHKNEILFSALCSLIGSGSSSYLFRELRENRALVYTTYAQHMSFTDAGLMMTYFACDRKKLFEATEAVAKVMSRVLSGISEDDIEFLISMMEGATYMSFEGVNNRMESIGRQEILLNRTISLKEALKELKMISKKSLDRSAKIFQKTPCFYVLGPVKNTELKQMKKVWESAM